MEGVSSPRGDIGQGGRGRRARRRTACALLAGVALAGATAVLAPPSRAAVPRRAARPDRAPLTGYLATPTEELAVPGELASGEITPAGDIYTGWAEYQFSAGPRLAPWSQPTRVAPDPGEPLYVGQLRRGAIDYRESAFTVAIAGEPVVELTLSARNRSAAPRLARVAMQLEYTRGRPIATFDGVAASRYRYPRPATQVGGVGRYEQLGEPFDPAWVYTVAGRDVSRDGLLLARGPAAEGEMLPTAGDGLTSAHAREAYAVRLAPRGRTSWTWQIPLDPPPASPVSDGALDAFGPRAAAAAFHAAWKRRERRAMRVTLPEPRIADVYRESLTNILAARDHGPEGWVQTVNRFQYQAYWLRDSSIMTVALDEAGLHVQADQNLGFLGRWQQPDGQYISQLGEDDGVGEALWEMDEHARLGGDPGYARSVLARVGAAVGWIAAQSAADPEGLLPPTSTTDDEQIADARITGDEIWAAVGLRSAIGLARIAGRADLVTAWRPVDARFETALRAALSADQAANGHITPALDVPGRVDWGNYDLGYPLPIVSLRSVEMTSIIAWEKAHSDQGLADYSCRRCLHDYLGFPIFESELRRGGRSVAAAIAGLYAETAHTTATGAGWEDGPIAVHNRATVENLAPHGTFAGQYVSLLHNLLVDDAPGRITLLAGVSPAWMAPGDRIRVARAATSDGPLSLALHVRRHGATLRWSLVRFPGRRAPIVWALPYWVRTARSARGRPIRRAVVLRGDRGVMRLRWSARRPHQSLARAIATLDRDFTRAGAPAPLQPAPDW